MKIEKIKPKKSYELVMQQLQQQIEKGHFKPGQKLASVVDLAAAFNVGRSTIREALSALKAMGWLDIRQGGGTYVKQILPTQANPTLDLFHHADSLQEILDVRKILETGSAALAAKHRTAQDVQRIDEILQQMEQALLTNNEVLAEEADTLFHLHIARASGNTLLIELLESLSIHIQSTMRDTRRLRFYGDPEAAQRLIVEHRDIWGAIEQQNEELAVQHMSTHLNKVAEVLQQAKTSDAATEG